MHVAFLTNVFPSPIAPTKGTFNLELARALARQHDISAIVPISWIDELKARLGGRRLPASRRCEANGICTHFPRFWYPPRLARSRYDRCLEWSIHKTLAQVAARRPNAVLGYWAHPDGAVAVRWARRLRVPGWIMVGGSDVLLLARERSRGDAIRQALQEADGVIAVSRDIAERLIRGGLPAQRVEIVPRGVDRTTFCLADQREARRLLGHDDELPWFVWAGRMVDVKNLDGLIAAADAARKRAADFRLVLLGDGPLRPALTRMISARGLNKHVWLVGSVPHHALAAWYQAADWTVLCSHSEGIPNALLESHACGTPFIATQVGGISEIVVDGSDVLVPAGDAHALADALCQAVRHRKQPSPRLTETVRSVDEAAQEVAALLSGKRMPAAMPAAVA
jgi:glycosyltransferase involved in cell wall biosynthesis